MNYKELTIVRDLLNKKFKGKPLPNTDYTVRDFVIIPDERYDEINHGRFKYAIELGVPLAEVEKTIDNNAHLDIMIRFTNSKTKRFYSLSEFGYNKEDLENYAFV